jgi:hypothetical protein
MIVKYGKGESNSETLEDTHVAASPITSHFHMDCFEIEVSHLPNCIKNFQMK